MGRIETLYEETPKQEVRRIERVLWHAQHMSLAGREYLAAFLLGTTQAELRAAGFRARAKRAA